MLRVRVRQLVLRSGRDADVYDMHPGVEGAVPAVYALSKQKVKCRLEFTVRGIA